MYKQIQLDDIEIRVIIKALKSFKSGLLGLNAKLRCAILDLEHLPNEVVARGIDSINSNRSSLISQSDILMSKLKSLM